MVYLFVLHLLLKHGVFVSIEIYLCLRYVAEKVCVSPRESREGPIPFGNEYVNSLKLLRI